MRARSFMAILLATVVVGRTLHCLATSACLCGISASSASGGSPWRNPDDADPNESGCICKGALVQPPAVFEVVRPGLDAPNLLATAWLPAGPVALPDPRPLRSGHLALLGPPPLGGRALRAWIASLLI